MIKDFEILGIKFDGSKRKKIYLALTEIYGIGIMQSKKLLNNLKINKNLLIEKLKASQASKLCAFINYLTIPIGGELKALIQKNIERIIQTKNFKGRRHSLGLPVRGQRTKSNAINCRLLSKYIKN